MTFLKFKTTENIQCLDTLKTTSNKVQLKFIKTQGASQLVDGSGLFSVFNFSCILLTDDKVVGGFYVYSAVI